MQDHQLKHLYRDHVPDDGREFDPRHLAALRDIAAHAWDEGFDAGEADVLDHEAKPNGWDQECTQDNPYRGNK